MFRRFAAVLAGSAIVVLALAGPASAHVTVNPRTATKGGFTKLAFRVPNEEASASTVKLEVQFPDPQTAPLAFASVQPHPGWTYKVDHTHLATPVKSDDGDVTDVVSVITWTANTPADGIKPGEFDEFNVSVGPLPKVDTMEFKAVQTYGNGDVVRWIEPTRAGQPAPAHPAPLLTLTAASGDSMTATTAKAEPTVVTKKETNNGLATAGVVVGAIALIVALIAVARKPGAKQTT